MKTSLNKKSKLFEVMGRHLYLSFADTAQRESKQALATTSGSLVRTRYLNRYHKNARSQWVLSEAKHWVVN